MGNAKNVSRHKIYPLTEKDFKSGNAVAGANGEYIWAKTLYQMCICSIRYGMARNNHLEPWGSIENVKEVLCCLGPSSEWAQGTAKQLIREVSTEIQGWELYHKESIDTNHNIQLLNEFVEWLQNFLLGEIE